MKMMNMRVKMSTKMINMNLKGTNHNRTQRLALSYFLETDEREQNNK